MTGAAVGLVGLGAALGAVARYRIGRIVSRRLTGDFPWGTWVVNVVGTLMLGILYQELDRYHVYTAWWAFLGTGFCGAFTTFSTMSSEALHLFRIRPVMCVTYLSSSILVGVLLATLTHWV